MNKDDPNVAKIETVAAALGGLCEELVFVGGCAVGLLVSDPVRPPVRATNDVDLIAEVTSRAAYYALADRLKMLGFAEDHGEIICRWRLRELVIDVMPTDEGILGFSNRWYLEALRRAGKVKLPSGREIRLVSAPLLLATKIEAFYGRGRDDYGASHDIEDILTIVDGRAELIEEIQSGDEQIRGYLQSEVDDLLAEQRFVDAVPWHFGATDQDRVPVVIERLRQIAGV